MIRKRFGLLGLCLLVGVVAYMSTAPAQTQATRGDRTDRVFIAMYSRGPAFVESASIFDQPTIKAHIAHHEQLGPRLIAAGPFRTDVADERVGAVVMTAASREDAQAWLSSDPAIVGKVFTGTLHEWRVSTIRKYEREVAASNAGERDGVSRTRKLAADLAGPLFDAP